MRPPPTRLAALLVAWAGCIGSIEGYDPSAADAGAGRDADPSTADASPGAAADAAAGDPSAELYADDHLPRFELEIGADALAALEADPTAYAPATFRYGDEVVTDVGVRLKGEWTFRPITAKASFKLKFDAFVPDRRFRGLARMTLNNALEDPSFVAERLTYRAFRSAGLPAPRANSAEVYVNGEPYGVYVNLETEDKTFLARWFASNDGNLYEEQGADWHRGNEQLFELETNEETDDRSDLTALFAAVEDAAEGRLLEDAASILDPDRFLRYAALEGLVNQWDGYAYTLYGPNNYRLYHDPTSGQFSLLPWGMDMSMKPCGDQAEVDLAAAAGYFLQRCVADEACAAAYWQVVAEEIDRLEALALDQVAEQAYLQIRDAVRADPRKEVDDETFEATVDQVIAFVRQRPTTARAQLP